MFGISSRFYDVYIFAHSANGKKVDLVRKKW